MEFVSDFLSNHQMLQANNRPVWRVVKGGLSYVDRLVEILGDRLKLNHPIKKIVRSEGQVILTMPDGSEQSFDEVILACHADQSLQLLSSPTDEETNLLSSFPYQKNKVTLHSDDSVIPKRKSARASWNAFLPKEKSKEALVTYDMNILQSLPTTEPFCVSLNQQNILSEEKSTVIIISLIPPIILDENKIRLDTPILFETKESLSVVLTGDTVFTRMV